MFHCKLCHSEVDVLDSVNTADIASAWKVQGVLIAPPEFKKVFLTHCPNCSFESWQPAWVGDGDFYAQLSSFAWYYESSKWEYQTALGCIRKDAKVLEVGCGKGEFLKLLVAKGIEAIGLDTNHNAIEAARSAGLNAIDADPRDYAASTTEKFDVVCHFQVLEHVPEPLPFLETCAKLLKPDGEIWMATPNQDSFIRYAPFLLLNLPPHHQTRWTASAYQTASQKLDLHLNKLEFEPLHKLHGGWALQSFLNKYFRIGIDRPYIKAERSLWKWAILKFAEMLGKIIFYPKWIRNRIRGHSILVSMGKLNLHPE